MAIKCCKDCVSPTRYLGCHAKCSKYLEEKAEYENRKEYVKAHDNVTLTNYDFDKFVYASSKRRKS